MDELMKSELTLSAIVAIEDPIRPEVCPHVDIFHCLGSKLGQNLSTSWNYSSNGHWG